MTAMTRQDWMGVLARAPAADLRTLWDAAGLDPAHSVVRAAETGAVMVRGRAGATGAPFNLGEMTVTRASVQLEDGPAGHGYVQGRDKGAARIAALVDALMQTPAAETLRRDLLEPLQSQMQANAATRAAKADATKVDFFTMVRGED